MFGPQTPLVLNVVRPSVPSQVFRDASGEVINYVNRWFGTKQRDANTYTYPADPINMVDLPGKLAGRAAALTYFRSRAMRSGPEPG